MIRTIRVDGHPIHLRHVAGVLTIAGEVPDISLKRRALREIAVHAAAHADKSAIADRVLVSPAVTMDDHSMLSHVRDALIGRLAFSECSVRIAHGGAHVETPQEPDSRRGEINVHIDDGVVTLSGHVPSLVHRRLLGVLCWWVPGSRDVINALEVHPPEEDCDSEIDEALRVVLAEDPFIDAMQLATKTECGVVALRGTAVSQAQRMMAEHDALYVLGVQAVVNRIIVIPE